MNNRVGNLRWGTAKENAADRERHGRTARGERNGYTNYRDAEVAEACSMVASGAKQRDVAKRFGCSQATISRWLHGERRSIATEAAALVAALEANRA